MIKMWLWSLLTILLTVSHLTAAAEKYVEDVNPSLQFVTELQSKLSFVNSTGRKIECKAQAATSSVKISWVFIDGSKVESVPGLRKVDGGNLEFYPFTADKFRPDIHSTVYRCLASTTAGVIRSVDVHVNGIINQNYEAQVYDVYVIEGNVAVMKCHTPAVIGDHIKTIAWIKNNHLLIEPKTDLNEKYAVIDPGFLHIRNVNISESASNYKCKTVNVLNGETKISPTGGHLFVTESQGNILPKISSTTSSFQVTSGDRLVIPCVGQGKPAPNLKWFKKNGNSQLTEIAANNNIRLTQSSLIIKKTDVSDAGIYVCELYNSNGRSQHDFTLSVYEKLSVDITPKVHLAKVEETVTFKCTVKGRYDKSILWSFNGNLVKSSEESLTVSATVAAQGFYQCLVKNDDTMVQATAELRLSEIFPYFNYTFEEVNMKPGETVNLTCIASGVPLPVVTWMLEESVLNNSQQVRISSYKNKDGMVVSMLKLRKVTVEDGGLYSCVASNDAGESRHLARVGVEGPLLAKPSVKVVAIAGKNAFLNCPVFGYPIEETTWTDVDNRSLTFKSQYTIFSNGTLWIRDVHRPTNSGRYFCTVKNSFNQKATTSVELDIVVPPKIVPFQFQDELLREGMRARLQCVVSEGDSPIHITWLKDGKSLTNDLGIIVRVLDEFSSILNINNILPKHNGKYTCVATNRAAVASHSTILSVNVLPKIIPFGFLDDQFYKGMRAHVTCAVSQGDVPLNFKWFKNGAAIPSNFGIVTRKFDEKTESLSIENVSSVHSGTYTCVVTNRAGTAIQAAELLVRVPPKIVPFRFGNLLYEGASTRVVCGLQEGDLPIHFQWLHNGYPVSDSDSVSIHELDGLSSIFSVGRLNVNHSGNYTCVAKNGAGVTEHVAALHVNGNLMLFICLVAPKIVPFEFQSDYVLEGALVRLTCVVYQGDLPLSITWSKDSLPIPDDFGISVRNVDTYTSILTVDRVESRHGGNYTCNALNSAAFASHTASLVIVPFTFQEDQLIESMLIRVPCIVSRGDLPLNIYWEKDGKKANWQEMGVSINAIDNYSSILSIANVTTKHNGIYTCYVQNAAGNASFAASLFVQVPPRWIRQPKEVISSITGSTIVIDCLAEGYPKPVIEWTFLKDKTTTGSVISDNYSMQVSSNGSLVIYSVTNENEGHYICKASNGVGRPLEAVIQIKINAPPYFSPGLQDMKVVLGKNVQWHCVVSGNKPIEIRWQYYGKPINYLSNNRITVQMLNHTQHAESTLTIHRITRDDGGHYQCVANNSYGSNVSASVLTVFEPPESPVELRVLSQTSSSIELEWKIKFNGNDPIKKFIIQYKNESISWNDAINMETINGEPTNSIIAHLRSATVYNFRVYAENSVGRSTASQILTTSTDEDVPAAAPLEVQIIPLNEETFKVEWLAPAEELWNGKLLGFSVGFKDAELDEPFTYKTLLTPDPRVKPLSVVLSGLKQFTKYSVVVQAYTSKGKGPSSDPVIAMTSEGAPTSAPTDSRCTTLSSRAIHVTWDPPPPSTINGILHGYKISYKAVFDDLIDDNEEFHNKTLSNSFTLNMLEKFTNYSIQILAMTRSAEGPYSSPIYCTTLDDVPDAPSDIKAAASSDSSVIVSWKSPDKSNGVIKFYKIYWRELQGSQPASVGTVGSNIFSYEITMLRNATVYEFWVTSSTVVGEGPPSNRLKQKAIGPASNYKFAVEATREYCVGTY
ncbi:Down syndrome cell adhesion molecule-like protein 1 [Chamberlinius hualienensis]